MKGLPFVLLFTAMTFVSWGAYGPVLHHGAIALEHDSMRAFVGVGLAYFLIAVIIPFAILRKSGEKGQWTLTGTVYSIIAGAVGAIGALGIILALGYGGQTLYVMPLVFGFAPVVNTLVTAFLSRSFNQISPIFIGGIITAALGASGVLIFKPSPTAKPSPADEKPAAHHDSKAMLPLTAIVYRPAALNGVVQASDDPSLPPPVVQPQPLTDSTVPPATDAESSSSAQEQPPSPPATQPSAPPPVVQPQPPAEEPTDPQPEEEAPTTPAPQAPTPQPATPSEPKPQPPIAEQDPPKEPMPIPVPASESQPQEPADKPASLESETPVKPEPAEQTDAVAEMVPQTRSSGPKAEQTTAKNAMKEQSTSEQTTAEDAATEQLPSEVSVQANSGDPESSAAAETPTKKINIPGIVASIIIAALCWGSYGPMLHIGQAKMNGSRLRPFACVGIAYFLIAVVAPLFLIYSRPEDLGHWTALGMGWSFLAGIAGAIGALGVILAFNAGGKPYYVMPLIFGFAPVINTFISLSEAGTWSKVQPMFWVSLAVVIAGAVTVLTNAPKPKPKPADAAQ